MSSKKVFLTTFCPYNGATGFQKVSSTFLNSVGDSNTALFCLHPGNLTYDVPGDHELFDVKVFNNVRKTANKFFQIIYAITSILSLKPMQIITHKNRALKEDLQSFFDNHEVSHVYLEAVWLLELLPKTKAIPLTLHAHILDSDHLKSHSNVGKKILHYPFYLLLYWYEKKNFYKFSSVITNSNQVKGSIEKITRDGTVELKKNFYNVAKIDKFVGKFGKEVLLMGDFSYGPNLEALNNLLSFIDEYPDIADKLNFSVVGILPKIEEYRKKNKIIKFTGFVDDVYLTMSNFSISICPLSYASGAKIKVIESLRMGIPVITSQACIDASGCQNEIGTLAYTNSKEFYDLLLKLSSDKDYWCFQSKVAKNYAIKEFDC